MNLNVRSPELALDIGQVLTLQDAAGLSIRARSGAVWVTEEGSPHDYILSPGQTLIVHRDGRTVVQALKASWIALAEGPAAANDSEQ